MTKTDKRNVLVSGSTSGIGEAIATAFARDGATVVINGRDRERTEAAVERIRSATGHDGLIPVAADLGTAEGAQIMFDAVPHVDVLVNNLGIFGAVPLFEITDEEWRRYFEVNVLSGVRLARRYTPLMVKSGWGRVIFISSESSLMTPSEMVHYGVTKTAQLSVSRGLAQEVAGTGVTVNAILAGPTLTPGVATFIADRVGADVPFEEAERRFMAEERPGSLLQRLIRPEEIASLVHYVGSDAASATTGAALRVDGGLVPTIVP
ncbi:SDR family NAD(P)-dependent oxidoreductase [Streptosporangium sp. 'caverna']|uniref:SDR family NAD(P)-dependent oxidoreductase n=1 Tax=Streptosporangium sp. 'caverna' TaxID=2202249 RepID=UPI000D7D5732|nr:SDR family oxidoreductase [Streptosporangium sp. 'caverna']AWS43052.1 oxidoreductase [Streptosporangium sp. 'caverna']